jgi:PHD/YefM family antitoxin component YafN of YafNO toxin-antitoxin module
MKTLKLIEFENNKENLLIFMNKDKDKLKVTNKNRS